MKKILACTVAAILAASMMTACGSDDSSSSGSTTTTTKAAESAVESTEESKADSAEESAADSAEESKAEESTADESKSDETASAGTQFTPISGVADALKNYDNCSLKFNADTDVNAFVEMFNEEVNGKKPGDEGYYDYGDEAYMELSVEDVAGIPMLKMNEVFEKENVFKRGRPFYWTPKIRFDMNKMFKGHEEDMEKIFTMKVDIVCIARDQAVYDENADGDAGLGPVTVAWYGGAFGCNNNDKWDGNLIEWSCASLMSGEDSEVEWANQWAYTEVMARPGLKDSAMFKKDYEKNFMTIMAWQVKSHIDWYIADIVFEDEDGNIIPVPAENIPGGASYEQQDNSDLLPDGVITRDENGIITSYKDMDLGTPVKE